MSEHRFNKPFDVNVRTRDTLRSTTSRLRELLKVYVSPEDLDSAVQDVLRVVVEYAGEYHSIRDRERVRQKRSLEDRNNEG